MDYPAERPEGASRQTDLTFQIDPTQNPKRLDLVRKGAGADGKDAVEKCLYKLEKDTLTVCSPVREGGKGVDYSKERPKEFKVTEGGIIRVFKKSEM